MADPECLFCGRPAVAWCDAAIAFPLARSIDDKGKPTKLIGFDAGGNGVFTCDAPLCATHSHHVGFVCGKEPDTIDHCAYHFRNPCDGRPPIVTKDDADYLRRELHARIRRERIKGTTMPDQPEPSSKGADCG